MSLRVTTTQSKVVAIVMTYVFAFTASAVVGVAAGTPTGVLTLLALMTTSVVIFTRVFRGASEDIRSPRAWWRMTEKPRASYVVAIVFGAETVYLAVALPAGERFALNAIAVIVSGLITAAFINSSIRLNASNHGTQRDNVYQP